MIGEDIDMTDINWFAKVCPQRYRNVHRWYAEITGYFWLPCPLCGEEFGGHEWRDIDGKSSCVYSDPAQPNTGTGICPDCTRAGKGTRPGYEGGLEFRRTGNSPEEQR